MQIWYTGGLLSLIGWVTIIMYTGFVALQVLYHNQNGKTRVLFIGLAAAILAIILMDQFQDAIYQLLHRLSEGNETRFK